MAEFEEVTLGGWKRLKEVGTGKLVPFQKGNEFTGSGEGAVPNWDFSSFGGAPKAAGTTVGGGTQSAIELMLKYGPQLAQSEFDTRKRLLPQELALQKELGPEFQSYIESLRSSDRTADISDIQSLLPQLQAIQRDQLTPDEQRLKDLLSGQITDDLALGQTLSPEQARTVEQAARTAEGARGISAGRGSANREAVRKALEGRRLQTERQGAASSFLAQSAAERIDPVLAVTGRASTALTAGQRSTAPGTTPSGTGQANQAISFGNQFAQQDLAQDKYNLQLQLAQNLNNRFGF